MSYDDHAGSLLVVILLLRCLWSFSLARSNWHGGRGIACSQNLEMACHAVDSDEQVFAYFWLRWRWKCFVVGRCGIILALSFPLLPLRRSDVGFAMFA